MKYEFHVGDYVETKDGWIGYVTTIDQYWSKVCTCWGLHIIGNIQKNNNKGKLDIDIAQSDIWRHFNRIGQYDFKKDKVEPLSINKHISIYCGNGKTNSPSDYKTAFEQDELNDKMIDKINEIVDAVNELRNKND